MDPDLQKLEAELAAIRPAGLDRRLLDRLQAAVSGELVRDDAPRSSPESELADIRPAAVPAALVESFMARVGDLPFSMDDKVLLFPGNSSSTDREKTGSRRGWLAAAAAVALAGALSAFFFTPPGETAVAEERTPPAPSTGSAPPFEAGPFMPATYGSNVSDSADLGLLWSKDRRPMRVMRFVYKDTVRFINDKGETVEMEVPRVEYLAVPEKID